MKILAIDTTSCYASAAVCDGDTLLAGCTINSGNTHTETLLPMIRQLLLSCRMTVSDVDLFACSAGPGSFTGVRIGVSVIKGLAFGREKPCVPVSTLEALAYNIAGSDGILCPVMDARRSQLYNALFEMKDGKLIRLTQDRVISAEQLDKELLGYNQSVCLCGDGLKVALSSLTYNNIYCAPELLRAQNGYSVARCAAKIYINNPDLDYSDSSLSPVYLRDSQAERERKEKNHIDQE